MNRLSGRWRWKRLGGLVRLGMFLSLGLALALPAWAAEELSPCGPPPRSRRPIPRAVVERAAAKAQAAAAKAEAARAAAEKAEAAAKALEPDWSKDYEGKGSGDVEPWKPRRFVCGEWRANRFSDGRLLTEWEVRLTDTGEVVRWGIYRRYYPSGRLAVLGAYRNDRPAGVWMWIDETGQVQRRARQQAEYEDDLASDPLANPRSQFRNSVGKVIAEGQLKQDKPHGLWLYLYDNGAPKAQGRYLTGLPDGTWSYFFPDGEVEKQVAYALGVPHGPYRLSYTGGQEQERGQYDEGVRTGIWRIYYSNGQEREVGAYREDRRDGEWKSFDDEGRLTALTLYAQGVVKRETQIPPPPGPPEPLVSDVDALTPPRILDAQGRTVQRVEDWDSPAKASDADGRPIPLTPPPRRPPPPPLSRWTSPTGGESKSSLP